MWLTTRCCCMHGWSSSPGLPSCPADPHRHPVPSRQELVDCDHDNVYGCQGGLMDFGFQWIIDNGREFCWLVQIPLLSLLSAHAATAAGRSRAGGIDTEADYPYLAQEQQCNWTSRYSKVVSIDG